MIDNTACFSPSRFLGMEKSRAEKILSCMHSPFSFEKIETPWDEKKEANNGEWRVIRQETVNGTLLLTASLFDVLPEGGERIE